MMGSPTSNRPQHYPYRPNGFDDMDPFSMQGIIEEQRLQEQESATYVARSKLPLRIRNLLSQKRDGIPRVITFVSVLGKAAAEDDNSGDLSHIGMVIEVLHDDEGFEPRRNHQRRRSKSFDTEICHRDYDQGSFNTSMSSIQTHSRPSLNKMTLTEFIPKDSIHSKEQFKARHHTNHQTQSREYCDGSVSSSPTSYPHSLHSSAISTLHNSISQQSVASSSRPIMCSAKQLSSERSISPKPTLHSRHMNSTEHSLSHDNTNSFKCNSPLSAPFPSRLNQIQRSNSKRQLRPPHSIDPSLSLQSVLPKSCGCQSCPRLHPSDPSTLVMSTSYHTKTQQQDKRQNQHTTLLAEQSSTGGGYRAPTHQDLSQIPRTSTLTFIDSMFASKSFHPRALQEKRSRITSFTA